MGKKYYDFKYQLEIDGHPFPPEKVAPLFQRDPFPGGHKYSCVISGKRLGKYFGDFPLERKGLVSEADARTFFSYLQTGWYPTNGENTRLEYFLNNVEIIDFDGERLSFSGICSPVVR